MQKSLQAIIHNCETNGNYGKPTRIQKLMSSFAAKRMHQKWVICAPRLLRVFREIEPGDAEQIAISRGIFPASNQTKIVDTAHVLSDFS
jgi:hypothetical protein